MLGMRAAVHGYLLLESEMKRPLLILTVPYTQQAHRSYFLKSRRERTELRAQKAKLSHFKGSQEEPSLPCGTSFGTPQFSACFLVTVKSDEANLWVGFFCCCLFVSWPVWPMAAQVP
jgi:hypothetical protein